MGWWAQPALLPAGDFPVFACLTIDCIDVELEQAATSAASASDGDSELLDRWVKTLKMTKKRGADVWVVRGWNRGNKGRNRAMNLGVFKMFIASRYRLGDSKKTTNKMLDTVPWGEWL